MKLKRLYFVLLLVLVTTPMLRAEDPDYGNDKDHATTIVTNGTTVYGALTASDEDWFTYIPSGTYTKYQITFRNIDSNWKTATVYQDRGWANLDEVSYTSAYHEIKSFTYFIDTTDPIYIKVSGSTGGYEVTVTAVGNYPPDGYANDAASANLITVGGAATVGTISLDETDHVDWFKFHTTALHKYHINLTRTANSNVYFYIYKADGTTRISGGTTDLTLVSWHGEDYKIQVYGDPGRLGNYYELQVDDIATYTDSYGNERENAGAIAVGTDLTSTIEYNATIGSDEDWLVFTPQAHSLYRVSFTNYVSNWKTVTIYQYRDSEALVEASYCSAYNNPIDPVQRTIFVDNNDPIYLKVNGSTGNYKVRVDKIGTYPSDGYSKDCSNPTPLTVDADAIIGTLSPDESPKEDWFKFFTLPLHKYRIVMTVANNSAAQFELYDNNCATRLRGNTRDITLISWFGNDFKIKANGNAPLGNYYTIRVEDVDTYTDDYPNVWSLAPAIRKDATWYAGSIDYQATLYSDEDWVKFVAPQDGSYDFRFQNFISNWKTMTIFSKDQANILHQRFSRSAYNALRTDSLNLTADTYYIRITGGSGDYRFSVLSPEPRCGDLDHPYPPGDINQDCIVDIRDLAIMASNWLTDNNPQ